MTHWKASAVAGTKALAEASSELRSELELELIQSHMALRDEGGAKHRRLVPVNYTPDKPSG
jgi:hypothetical protein